MNNILEVIISASELNEAKRLFELKRKVQLFALELFKEIEEISGRTLPLLGICLHDQISANLSAPLPHLPAWFTGKMIHFLPYVEWWKKEAGKLLEERLIGEVDGAYQVIKEYIEQLNLESLVYILCGHEACHNLGFFVEDEKYYNLAPRWIEEGLCFYIPYKLVEKINKRFSRLALETDCILFEALRQQMYNSGHSLSEFYDFNRKYSKVGKDFKHLVDSWDYSTSVVAVHELSSMSGKSLKELISAVSISFNNVSATSDRLNASKRFLQLLFTKLGIQGSVDDFCARFVII